jgi:cytochrome c peroxidase
MNRHRVLLAVAWLVMAGFTACGGAGTPTATVPTPPPNPFQVAFQDSTGTFSTFSEEPIDVSNPFFKKLGTNERTCASCHDASDGWSTTPAHLQQRFQTSQGMDPVFRPVDGANCPSADVSTVDARSSAYSLLLNKGLIRISLPLPANAEFSIISIDDPYQCPETTAERPALYRRTLPSTNLRFLNGIMWDGREPDLLTQARNATLVHAESKKSPPDSRLQHILDLENSLFTAQSADNLAGDLSSQAVSGGPAFLSTQPFSPGINSGSSFDPNAFTLFSGWSKATGSNSAAQQSIARGEVLFNFRPMIISVVPGFNDVQGNAQIVGTCTTCHNAPNTGGSSDFTMMNTGTSTPSPDLPTYVLLCNDGTQVTTTDPGRALVTGKCADIGKVKIPGLRDLAARPPYFHNGSSATLMDVVNFYDQRFNMMLTEKEKADMVAFMNSL